MSPTSQSREQLLASISFMSKKTIDCLESGPNALPTAKCTPNVLPESMHIPKPPPLLSPLLEAGAPQHLAQEMHTIYLDQAKKLRSHYTAAISRLRKDLPCLPTDSVDTFNDQLVPLLLRTYTKALEGWMRDGVDMFHTRRPPAHKKPFNQTFNHDYVPLLEQFFDENPFPTHADKAFLARKSGMSYQQIRVWFQNRRSRSRKVGKVLRKKAKPESTALPLDSFRVCLDKCVTKPDEAVIDVSYRERPENSGLFDQSFDHCAVIRPSHSTQSELEFDLNWWPRRSSLTKPRQSSFDMDSLVEKLSQLSVRDRTSGRGKKHQDGLRFPLAVTSSITVVPAPAPHPALIRRRSVLSPPLPPLVVPRTSASRTTRLRAFNPPSSSPSPNPLASSVSAISEAPRWRRKLVSRDSSLGVSSSEKCSTFECGAASLRAPQMSLRSISALSTNAIDHVLQKNCSPWDFPFGRRSRGTVEALSQRAIPPWNFRCTVTV